MRKVLGILQFFHFPLNIVPFLLITPSITATVLKYRSSQQGNSVKALVLKLYSKETSTHVLSCEICEILKDTLKAFHDFKSMQKVYEVVTKTALLFLSRAPTHHSFTFNLGFLYELKYKVRLCKKVCGIF